MRPNYQLLVDDTVYTIFSCNAGGGEGQFTILTEDAHGRCEAKIISAEEIGKYVPARLIEKMNKALSRKGKCDNAEEKKRDYSKFFTPEKVSEHMVLISGVQEGDLVIDPHAGNGALIKAVKQGFGSLVKTIAIELYDEHADALRAISDDTVISDCLSVWIQEKANVCIANPPFGNGIKLLDHFNKICNDFVKVGGTVTMIVPKYFKFPIEKKYRVGKVKSFPIDNWATNSDGTVTPIKIISFKNL